MLLPNSHITAGLAASAGIRPAAFVEARDLASRISPNKLVECASDLQEIAYSTPARNRLMGSAGHNATVDYIVFELERTGYFDIIRQPFSSVVQKEASAKLTVHGDEVKSNILSYSPAGNVEAEVSVVKNQGCEVSDFSTDVDKKVALIERGGCAFGVKSSNAAAAGAVGAIVYNNVPGEMNGTLGVPDDAHPFVPSVSVSQQVGHDLLDATKAGLGLEVKLNVHSVIEIVTTENVLAKTRGGDQANALSIGAHTDSVAAGPGINDNGSGTCGLLNVAKALSKFRTKNAIHFNFWSGEEEGLLGSTHYVKTASKDELATVRLYLNFDMIASPNYVIGVYDGDGSAFNQSGPAGSAEAEHLFEDWFFAENVPSVPSKFDGRSDYGPFLAANIASGGLFTGADEIKTEAQKALYGGTAGIPLDPNYHQKDDTLSNLNVDAFHINARAIAAAVGTYAISFDSLNQPGTTGRVEAAQKKLAGVDLAAVLDDRSRQWRAEHGDVELS